MFFDNFICNVKILDVLKLSWNCRDTDTDAGKFHALSFCIKGHSCYTVSDNNVFIRNGDILFVPKNLDCQIKGEALEFYVIRFEFVEKEQNYLEIFHVDDYLKAQNLFAKCYEVWNKQETGYYFKVLSLFFNILELVSVFSQPTTRAISCEKLNLAMEYLHEHFTTPELSVTSLCNLAQMSDTWFRKLFQECYGTTPVKYINNLRIVHAKELMERGYCNIGQIATMSGFNDSKYFYAMFKQLVGCSPSHYIKKRNMEEV